MNDLAYCYKLHIPNCQIQVFLFLTTIFPELCESVMYIWVIQWICVEFLIVQEENSEFYAVFHAIHHYQYMH